MTHKGGAISPQPLLRRPIFSSLDRDRDWNSQSVHKEHGEGVDGRRAGVNRPSKQIIGFVFRSWTLSQEPSKDNLTHEILTKQRCSPKHMWQFQQ